MGNVGAPAAVFIAALAVFWLSPVRAMTDSHYSVLLSETMLQRGSVHLDGRIRPPRQDPRIAAVSESTHPYQILLLYGHAYYLYPPGTSVLSIPFVAVMNSAGISASAPDGTYDEDGERLVQSILASFLMATAVVVFFLTSRIVLPLGPSILLGVGVGLGTPVWSTASRVLWSHTWEVVLLGLVALALVASEWRARPVNTLLLGTLLAWAYFVRPTAAIPWLVISAYVAVVQPRSVGWYVATCSGWLGLLAAYSLFYFGQPLPPYYAIDALSRPLSMNVELDMGFGPAVPIPGFLVGLAGHLLSPSRGLFIFVPIVLFVGYLLIRYHRWLPFPRLVIVALAIVAIHLLVVSRWPEWWGGHAYGPRLLTDIVPWLFVLAVAGWKARTDWFREQPWAHMPLWRRVELGAGGALLVASVAMQAPGALSWGTHWWNVVPTDIDRHPERVWDWGQPQFLAGLTLGDDVRRLRQLQRR